ncbi:MAG: hypothetical protein MR216_04470 [Bacteroidales bacterium]|nr:hypothetical protein [Bacteroidales bacterium]
MHNYFMIVYVHACVRGCLCLSGVAYRDRTPTAIRPYGSWCTGVWQLEYGAVLHLLYGLQTGR